jgi:L-serine dehydratase
VLIEQTYYSVGGGFVEADHHIEKAERREVPYPFTSGAELLEICNRENMSIAEIAFQNWIQSGQPCSYVSKKD